MLNLAQVSDNGAASMSANSTFCKKWFIGIKNGVSLIGSSCRGPWTAFQVNYKNQLTPSRYISCAGYITAEKSVIMQANLS